MNACETHFRRNVTLESRFRQRTARPPFNNHHAIRSSGSRTEAVGCCEAESFRISGLVGFSKCWEQGSETLRLEGHGRIDSSQTLSLPLDPGADPAWMHETAN
jgi:hypothetical protein